MKVFLLLLDASSVMAASPAIREPDGWFAESPFWICTEVDASGPLLRAVLQTQKRTHLQERKSSVAAIYVPYSTVHGILESSQEQLPAFGFAPYRS